MLSQEFAPARQWVGLFAKSLKSRTDIVKQRASRISEAAFGVGVEKRLECFGSVQYDMCLPDSDIDLCIVVKKRDFKNAGAVLQPVFDGLRRIGHSVKAKNTTSPMGRDPHTATLQNARAVSNAVGCLINRRGLRLSHTEARLLKDSGIPDSGFSKPVGKTVSSLFSCCRGVLFPWLLTHSSQLR